MIGLSVSLCIADIIRGNVYGFCIIDPYGEMLDSCWGFYGDAWKEDSDMIAGARGLIDFAETEHERYIERLQAIADSY